MSAVKKKSETCHEQLVRMCNNIADSISEPQEITDEETGEKREETAHDWMEGTYDIRYLVDREKRFMAAEIMVAGGRTINLRDLQSMIFMAGASALMVGNYLTTLNQSVDQDLQMLRDLGLSPDWKPELAKESSCTDSSCGCGVTPQSEEVSLPMGSF